MVATPDCGEKSKPIAGHKVSKPVMEKKRRARINKCLDQLKSLLESYYSTNIRKRKLEKADILELTVKHLRNLQKLQSCSAVSSEFSDYQTGFRNCLANLNQYLVMAGTLNGGDRWMLSQLSGKLCRSVARGEVSSTMDSGLLEEARRLHPSAARPEEGNTGRLNVLKPLGSSTSCRLSSEDTRPSPGAKRAVAAATPPTNSQAKSPSHKKCVSVAGRDQAADTQHNVWRPW